MQRVRILSLLSAWMVIGNLGEVELDSAAGHLEYLTLRLYNPQTREWSMNITSSAVGVLSPPAIGGTWELNLIVNGRLAE